MGRISSYDPDAIVPKIGTKWVWELNSEHARQIIEVTEVKWNGEEWWVESKSITANLNFGIPPRAGNAVRGRAWNDLSRFWEACTAIAPAPGPRSMFTTWERRKPNESDGGSASGGTEVPVEEASGEQTS